MSDDKDFYEPWRRQGFICKPYAGHRGDGLRFRTEYLSAAAALDADTAWKHDEVLTGVDGGGDAAGAPAHGTGAGAGGLPGGGTIRERQVRLKTVAAKFLMHFPGMNDHLAALRSANPASAHDARAMFVYFERNMMEPMARTDQLEVKAEIQQASILGAVGFDENSVLKFKMWLDRKNSTIQPVGDQISDQDLCERMLMALTKCGHTYISGEAQKEINAIRANWVCHNGNAGAARRRSMQRITEHFGAMWTAAFNNKTIPQRAPGGKGATIGSSTRTDGFEASIAMVDMMSLGSEQAEPGGGMMDLNSLPAIGTLRDAFVAATSTKPTLSGAAAKRWICFNCFGLDHTKMGGKMPDGTTLPPCAAPRAKRDLKAFILLITAFASRNAGRAGITPVPSDGGNKKPPNWWRQKKGQARKPQAYVLEDASIRDENDQVVGHVAPETAQLLQIEMPCAPCDDDKGAEQPEEEVAEDMILENEMADPFSDQFEMQTERDDVAPSAVFNIAPVMHVLMQMLKMTLLACAIVSAGSMLMPTAALMMKEASEAAPAIGIITISIGAMQTMISFFGMRRAATAAYAMLVTYLALCFSPFTLPERADARPLSNSLIAQVGKKVTSLTARQVLENAEWSDRGFKVITLNDIERNASNRRTSLFATNKTHCYDMTIDSGAESHSTGLAQDINGKSTSLPRIKVRVADGNVHQVQKIGESTQIVKVRQSGVSEFMSLSEMMYVPQLKRRDGTPTRLFGVIPGFNIDKIETYFNNINKLKLPDRRRTVVHMKIDGNKPKIRCAPAHDERQALAAATLTDALDDDPELNHSRLMHFSANRTGAWKHDPTTCKACMLGGHKKAPYQKRSPRERGKECTFFGERVASDIAGPFPVSITGHRYMIVFYDYYTGEIDAKFLKSKEAQAISAALRQYQTDHAKWLKDGKVYEWCTDGDGGFSSPDVEATCADLATRKTFSIAGESNTNATAERTIGILQRAMRIVCAQCIGRGDPYPYWTFIASQVKLVHNNLPSRHHQPPQAPTAVKTGKEIAKNDLLKKCRKMFTRCYVRLADVRQQNRLSATAHEALVLGWDEVREGTFVVIPSIGRITTVRSVRFNEYEEPPLPPTSGLHIHHSEDAIKPAEPNVYQQDRPKLPAPAPMVNMPAATAIPTGVNVPAAAIPRGTVHATPMPMLSEIANQLSELTEWPLFLYKSASQKLHEIFTSSSESNPIPIPKSVEEALAGPYRKEWLEAMTKDIGKKDANGTWTIVSEDEPRNIGTKVHKGRWAFHVKYHPDGSVKEFRARWVMKGFTMMYGRDYDDTFIGAANVTSNRTLFAKAAALKLPIFDIDITAAFSTAQMDRELYVECPHGFGAKGKVCLMHKSLEGGKSSGALYYKEQAHNMTEVLKLDRSAVDPNLYKKIYSNGSFIYINLYVDNLLILPSSTKVLDEFIAEYKKLYKITGGEEVKEFVGCVVERNAVTGEYKLHQKGHIERIWKKYLGPSTKPRSSPIDTGAAAAKKFLSIKKAQTDAERTAMAGKDYLGLAGALRYVTDTTRPDVSYYLSFLAQFSHDPSPDAYEALLCVASYLYKTRSIGITFGGEPQLPDIMSDPPLKADQFVKENGLHSWSDASWGTPSYAGHVITLCNGPICWSSKKIKVTTLSSAEAEICSGVACCKDMKFVREVMKFLDLPIIGPTPLIIDAEAMWFHTRNTGVSRLTRHFEIWQNFVREQYNKRYISVHKTDTNNERADLLTKPLPKVEGLYRAYRNIIMNVNANDEEE